MYKAIMFVSKLDELSLEQFKTTYEQVHVPYTLAAAPAPAIYKRYYLDRSHPIMKGVEASVDFDAVVEVGFANKAACDEWASKFRGNEEAKAAQSKLMKISETRAYEVEESVSSEMSREAMAASGYESPFTVFVLACKKPEMDLATYRDYYETQHTQTLLRFGPMPILWKRYFFNNQENLREGSTRTVSYDMVAVASYRSEAAFQAEALRIFSDPEGGPAIAASEDACMVRKSKVLIAVQECETSTA